VAEHSGQPSLKTYFDLNNAASLNGFLLTTAGNRYIHEAKAEFTSLIPR